MSSNRLSNVRCELRRPKRGRIAVKCIFPELQTGFLPSHTLLSVDLRHMGKYVKTYSVVNFHLFGLIGLYSNHFLTFLAKVGLGPRSSGWLNTDFSFLQY